MKRKHNQRKQLFTKINYIIITFLYVKYILFIEINTHILHLLFLKEIFKKHNKLVKYLHCIVQFQKRKKLIGSQ